MEYQIWLKQLFDDLGDDAISDAIKLEVILTTLE